MVLAINIRMIILSQPSQLNLPDRHLNVLLLLLGAVVIIGVVEEASGLRLRPHLLLIRNSHLILNAVRIQGAAQSGGILHLIALVGDFGLLLSRSLGWEVLLLLLLLLPVQGGGHPLLVTREAGIFRAFFVSFQGVVLSCGVGLRGWAEGVLATLMVLELSAPSKPSCMHTTLIIFNDMLHLSFLLNILCATLAICTATVVFLVDFHFGH